MAIDEIKWSYVLIIEIYNDLYVLSIFLWKEKQMKNFRLKISQTQFVIFF